MNIAGSRNTTANKVIHGVSQKFAEYDKELPTCKSFEVPYGANYAKDQSSLLADCQKENAHGVLAPHSKAFESNDDPSSNGFDAVNCKAGRNIHSKAMEKLHAIQTSQHRRSNNVDFVAILPQLKEEMAAALRVDDQPNNDVSPIQYVSISVADQRDGDVVEISKIQKEIDELGLQFSPDPMPWSTPFLQPPVIPSIESSLEAPTVGRFYDLSREFWILVTPTSRYVSQAMKRCLLMGYQEAMSTMVQEISETLRFQPNQKSMLDSGKICELFSMPYQRATEALASYVGFLQVFKGTKERVGSLRHNMGVMYLSDVHSPSQNEKLNRFMRLWLFENWENPCLRESEIIRMAVAEKLSSTAIWDWWNHAMEFVWEPLCGKDTVHASRGRSTSSCDELDDLMEHIFLV